jgi:hypothetical protein
MGTLITKSFKLTLGLTLFPLAFLSCFGTTIVFAWTGETNPSFRVGLWLLAAAGLFQSFSILGLVLYRVSGRALMDNIRQVLRIATLLSITVFARRLGFYGVLGGLAVAELGGLLFMGFAITETFHAFVAKSLLPDALKLFIATAMLVTVGLAAYELPLPSTSNLRLQAVLGLAKISFACLLAAWPVLWLTKSVNGDEGRALLGAILPRGIRPAQNT